jgi:subtilisin family serine protease
MINKIAVVLTIALYLLLPSPGYTGQKISAPAREIVQQELAKSGKTVVIVELTSPLYRNKVTLQTSEIDRVNEIANLQSQFKASLSGVHQRQISRTYTFVPGVAIEVDEDFLELLEENKFVKNIFPNKKNFPTLRESTPLVFPNQSTSSYTGNNDWTVAVLDTGVDKNHSFLKSSATQKVISEACYSRGGYGSNYAEIDSLCPGEGFSSTAPNSGLQCSGYEGCDHGTHVAGIAVGDGNGFNGVASQGKAIAIQVFTGIRDVYGNNLCGTGPYTNCISAFDVDILSALERVYQLRTTFSIAAVNMSLGGGLYSGNCDGENTLVTNIIRQLKNAKIATIVASGNDSVANSISWPACISHAIAVGATYDSGSEIDQITGYSNESAELDLLAPGSYIYSSVPNNSYSTFEGTSMAAPHVAGAWAAFRQAAPDASVDELLGVVKSQGPNITSWNGLWVFRRLDVTSSLKKLAPVATITPILYQLLLGDEEAAGK